MKEVSFSGFNNNRLLLNHLFDCNIAVFMSSVISFMKTPALFQNVCWSAHKLVYKSTKLQICKQWTLSTSKTFRFQRMRIEVVGN